MCSCVCVFVCVGETKNAMKEKGLDWSPTPLLDNQQQTTFNLGAVGAPAKRKAKRSKAGKKSKAKMREHSMARTTRDHQNPNPTLRHESLSALATKPIVCVTSADASNVEITWEYEGGTDETAWGRVSACVGDYLLDDVFGQVQLLGQRDNGDLHIKKNDGSCQNRTSAHCNVKRAQHTTRRRATFT